MRTTIVGWNLDPRKRSFAEWLVRSLEGGERITLFRDAMFNPIASSLLADELEAMLGDDRKGIWHVGGHDSASKYDFGIELAARLGLDQRRIHEGTITDARFAARRSADQRLAVATYEQSVGREMPTMAATIEALARDRITESKA